MANYDAMSKYVVRNKNIAPLVNFCKKGVYFVIDSKRKKPKILFLVPDLIQFKLPTFRILLVNEPLMLIFFRYFLNFIGSRIKDAHKKKHQQLHETLSRYSPS